MATKRDAKKRLNVRHPGHKTWVEGKHTYDGYLVKAWRQESLPGCTVLPTLIATAKAPFAPAAWEALIRQL